jgi:hypothetical protein
VNNTISIGKWKLPEELVMKYITLIRATENSPGTRYNYEFDEQRKECHQKLLDATGISPAHYTDYCEFTKAMREFEDDMFPSKETFVPMSKKLNTPTRGIIKRK